MVGNERNTSATAEHIGDVRTPEELVAEEVLSSCFSQGMDEAEEICAAVEELTIAHPDNESLRSEAEAQQMDQRIHKLKTEIAEREKVGQSEQSREETQLTRAIHAWAKDEQHEGECMRALRSLQGNSTEEKDLLSMRRLSSK